MSDSKKLKDEDDTPEQAVVEDAEIVTEHLADEVVEASENTDTVHVEKRKGGFVPMILGGAAAAAIGFGAAQYAGDGGWFSKKDNTEMDALSALVETQKNLLTELRAEILEIRSNLSDMPTQFDVETLDLGQTELNQSTMALSEQFVQVDRRLSDIENRPIPEIGATAEAVQTYEKELSAMRKMFEEELARIESVQKQTAQDGKRTTEQTNKAIESALLARILAALDSGVPFTETVSVLTASGVQVPDQLIEIAKSGVPTLMQLQADFAPVARAALKASASVAPASGKLDRFSAFLNAQLGTRSLEPKEGDSADAILSRAEAALRIADISTTLNELDGLPEPGLEQMKNWSGQARIRQKSLESAAALAANINE